MDPLGPRLGLGEQTRIDVSELPTLAELGKASRTHAQVLRRGHDEHTACTVGRRQLHLVERETHVPCW